MTDATAGTCSRQASDSHLGCVKEIEPRGVECVIQLLMRLLLCVLHSHVIEVAGELYTKHTGRCMHGSTKLLPPLTWLPHVMVPRQHSAREQEFF